jgi:hypothetical protein
MSFRRMALTIGLLCITQAGSHVVEGASPEWEAAFSIFSAPNRVYFRAHYLDGHGQTHQLRVWRDGKRRLRRQTDSAIDLYVDQDKAGEIDFRVVDHTRHVVIRGNSTSLHRIGRFTGWIGLAHVLDVPHGPYLVTKISGELESPSSSECTWFRLQTTVPTVSVNEVCWSGQWGLPVAVVKIIGKERLLQLTIDEVHTFEPDSAIFDIEAEKYIEIDARPDSDLFD